MLLVPRQLQRSGMTGNVPYYGGRLSPAQAYAASHPDRLPPPPPPPFDPAQALWQLHAAGVLTDEEYAELYERIRP
ncbi:MAG TPA: hypothetical protein PLZ93_16835 [Nocardioides sp.]|nr:hypothetical protein [Nocardioides sp.]HRI97285.1 hypothetical protein [Nocardioides sp.]HRK46923.1 hypothetical protein [Nocardioides sp.]